MSKEVILTMQLNMGLENVGQICREVVEEHIF
jgi:hypothetical protein